MPIFTKTYNVEPNEAQKNALAIAFKKVAEYALNEQNKDVEIVVNKFYNRLLATLLIDGNVFESRLIGVRGGLTIVW